MSARDPGLPPELVDYVEARTSFYLATASPDGDPYVQHRGGPPGFLVALDEHTLGFADYAGNRKYVTLGHLRQNPRAMLFLMDYPRRRRLKLWCDATILEGPPWPEAAQPFLAASEGKRIERVFVLSLRQWELNCPQHITPRYTAEEWRVFEARR
ncbi:MAG: pyridoxamine 5'-phosphate oxidase family protein [Sandaracinaceae bacterium]